MRVVGILVKELIWPDLRGTGLGGWLGYFGFGVGIGKFEDVFGIAR